MLYMKRGPQNCQLHWIVAHVIRRYLAYRPGYSWKPLGSNPGGNKRFFLLQNVQTCTGYIPTSFTVDCRAFSHSAKRPGREVKHFHLMPRLRTGGAIPLLPLYAFMARKGKPLPFSPPLPPCR
jgi:hypothetical protein